MASLPAPLPRRMELDWMLPQPVPPKAVDKVEEADHVPETIWAMPVKEEESRPVPP